MIGFLKGTLIFQELNNLLVETGGVAYEVQVSGTTSRQFKKGSFISLWIYTCLRQDSLELYGFPTPEEKELFLSLIKVKGVGPKMALLILGSCSLEQFTRMISEENIKALSALPKIGKRTAQQIILSLKDQISDTLVGSSSKSPYGEKLFSALENLGFHSSEIREALGKITWEDDLQKDLKQALSFLKSHSKP